MIQTWAAFLICIVIVIFYALRDKKRYLTERKNRVAAPSVEQKAGER